MGFGALADTDVYSVEASVIQSGQFQDPLPIVYLLGRHLLPATLEPCFMLPDNGPPALERWFSGLEFVPFTTTRNDTGSACLERSPTAGLEQSRLV